MANINLGPAITSTANTILETVPVNTQTSALPVGSNALRLLASWRAVSLTATGDTTAPVINAGTYASAFVVFANAVGGSAATANVTINTGAAVTGTNLRAAGVLAGVTGPLTAKQEVAASPAVVNTAQTLFLNSTVALAGVTIDVFFYGYDLT